MDKLNEILIYSANEHWLKFCLLYPKLNRFPMPIIKLNNRFTRTAGMNYQQERIVEISSKFLIRHKIEILSITLPHELAHQVDWDLFGESEFKHGHGRKWREIMLNFGLPSDRYHELKL